MAYLITDTVDIYEYPRKKAVLNNGAKVIFGDLHGNSIKLLFFVVHEGILNIDPDDYRRLIEIYTIPVEIITADELQEFNKIISGSTINQPAPKICFIGDDLADRGCNDYFTLKLFEKLSKENINFDVLVSNHGAEFLKQYMHGLDKPNVTSYKNYNRSFGNSLINLQTLIVDGKVSMQEVNDIVSHHYLQKLKLLNYSIEDENTISIYSHAPTNESSLNKLMNLFKIPFQQSINDISRMIDDLNIAFKALLSESNNTTLHDMNAIPEIEHFINDRYRDLAKAVEAVDLFSCNIVNIHGHVDCEKIPEMKTKWKYINLDGNLGKSKNKSQGIYTVYTDNADYQMVKKNIEEQVVGSSNCSEENIISIKLDEIGIFHTSKILNAESSDINTVSTTTGLLNG